VCVYIYIYRERERERERERVERERLERERESCIDIQILLDIYRSIYIRIYKCVFVHELETQGKLVTGLWT